MGNRLTNTKALEATKATSSQTWLYIVITWESLKILTKFSSVQSLSRVQLFVTP